MTQEQEEELRTRLALKTPKGWYGLAAPKGWYDIIDQCDKELEAEIPGYEVHQIKEKFGGLRYYIGIPEEADATYEQTQSIINKYETLSYKTCEECAIQKGVDLRYLNSFGSWPRRLCIPCAHKWAEQRESKLREETST